MNRIKQDRTNENVFMVSCLNEVPEGEFTLLGEVFCDLHLSTYPCRLWISLAVLAG